MLTGELHLDDNDLLRLILDFYIDPIVFVILIRFITFTLKNFDNGETLFLS
jgi:hypothetical protein